MENTCIECAKREKNKQLVHTGIAGLAALVFLMLAGFLDGTPLQRVLVILFGFLFSLLAGARLRDILAEWEDKKKQMLTKPENK